MTNVQQHLDSIEATAHKAWAELRQLQRAVSDPDTFYRTPADDRTAGDTLTHGAIASALETGHRFMQELEAIRLTLLVVEHGPRALAARSVTPPKTPAQRLFEQTTRERHEYEF